MRNYHSFSDWELLFEENENLENALTFGFELEVTRDYDYDEDDFTDCDDLANYIENEYPGIFICERDSSIGHGVEIISMPMTMNWYLGHISIFEDLLTYCREIGYVGEKGNLRGLHVHFGREGLGFSQKELEKYPPEKRNYISLLRQSEVELNIANIIEAFHDEILRISGRSGLGYCDFINGNSVTVKEKKVRNMDFYKKSNRGSHSYRYHAVNYTNSKTVEIRIMRSTVNFNTFNSRILFLYNLVSAAKSYVGIISFSQIINYGNNRNSNKLIRDYIVSNRGIHPNEISKMVSLNMENEYRIENLRTRWK